MRATTLNLFDAAYLAQTESPSITPETFGPVTRWWDADTLNYLVSGALVSPDDPWDDQSPNDDDAVSTIGREPSLQKNVINGHSTLRFVGDRMLFEGGDLELSDFTILCVALTSTDSVYLGRDGLNRQIRVNWLNQARASWFSGNSGSELVSNQFLSNLNLPRMIGHRRNLTTTGLFTFFDNATSVMPTTEGVNPGSFGINQIGTLGEFDPGMTMDVAELVIFNKALLDSEVQALYYQYFKPKFALP